MSATGEIPQSQRSLEILQAMPGVDIFATPEASLPVEGFAVNIRIHPEASDVGVDILQYGVQPLVTRHDTGSDAARGHMRGTASTEGGGASLTAIVTGPYKKFRDSPYRGGWAEIHTPTTTRTLSTGQQVVTSGPFVSSLQGASSINLGTGIEYESHSFARIVKPSELSTVIEAVGRAVAASETDERAIVDELRSAVMGLRLAVTEHRQKEILDLLAKKLGAKAVYGNR